MKSSNSQHGEKFLFNITSSFTLYMKIEYHTNVTIEVLNTVSFVEYFSILYIITCIR